jgi:hypothetical protein
VQNPPYIKRRPGRIAQAVAVNCGYWTKAIALKRKPGASSLLLPDPDPLVATPGKPDSFGDRLRRCVEELPRASVKRMQPTVKVQ